MNDLPNTFLDLIQRTHPYQLHFWKKARTLTPKQGMTLVVALCFGIAWFLFQHTPPVMSSAAVVQLPTATPPPAPISPTATATPTATSEPSAWQVRARVSNSPTFQPTPTLTPTPRLPYTVHTVTEDDTLLSIAAQYHISSETLLATNDIRHPETLDAGRLLVIPVAPQPIEQPMIAHRIQSGDNLLSLSLTYNVSISTIYEANPHLFGSGRLPVDAVMVLPMRGEDSSPEEELIYYTIEEGDTPLQIATDFDVPLAVLTMLNGIEDPRRLQVGDVLRIPPADDVSLGFPVVLHELREGDTLLGLSVVYGSSVKDILSVNPDLRPADLTPGDLVAVPVVFQPDVLRDDLATPTPVPVSGPLVEAQAKMVLALNAEREAAGLHRLLADSELSAVAVAHAQDMVRRGFFAHVTPEGLTLRDRVRAGGVNSFIRVGENIQRNTQPREQTAQAASDWFMGSPPHRGNMLHEHHNRVGVGIVEGPPGWFTIVLVFAER